MRRRRRVIRGEEATATATVTSSIALKTDDEAFRLTDSTHEESTTTTTNTATHSSSPSSSSKKSKTVFFDLRGTVDEDLKVLSSDAAVAPSKSKIYGDRRRKAGGDDEQIHRSSSNYSFLTVSPRDPNRRYGDFSDSEDGDRECLEIERRKVIGSKIGDENETSGSLFSISVGGGGRGLAIEADEKEVSSPISSMLKFGQDLHEQGSIKSSESKGLTVEEIEVGENLGFLENEEQKGRDVEIIVSPTHVWNSKSDNVNAEMVVDASLSVWIEDKNPSGTSSEKNKNTAERGMKIHEEDRPILGAMTMEEIKFINNSPSPPAKKFGRRNVEDLPIIGTVGSYWKHTSQTLDSVSSSSPCHSSVSNAIVHPR